MNRHCINRITFLSNKDKLTVDPVLENELLDMTVKCFNFSRM